MSNRYHFPGGTCGPWKVLRMSAHLGAGLTTVDRVQLVNGTLAALPAGTQWDLQGLTSNVRYATATELVDLRAKQQGLGRPEATCAALIPIKKTAAW